ncbi:hypothetical protein AXF41_00050 [Clostridium haemolyticum]|uniref:Ig-like domain-containing protein n=1 Tax=Clostridium haemolyticum TaxID=84025 RepID=UPI0009C9FDAB|nr:Ig-like domain-containing protein [Clostridium haemolyticum]OOB76756.1 hypothetical protein AXF41_00050 [Clostridium haemolyticum]
MSNNKTLKVFSSTAVAGMIAAAMMSSQAFAAVDAYSVKVGDQIYKYDRVQLEKSFLDSKAGDKAALYEDFTKKLGEAKGFYAFNDTKNGYVDYNSIEAKFLEAKNAGQKFDVNAFTESKDAKIVEVKAVKKAVVNKDGNVEYVVEGEDEKGDLKVSSIEALSLKQIKINFNKSVKDSDKKDDIEDEDNYTIYNSDNKEINNCVDKVELDESGKFAVLTFKDKFNNDGTYKKPKDTDDGIKNQETYKVEFDSNITGKEFTQEVKFNLFSFPEVKAMKVVGSDAIKVTFTEPVKPYKLSEEIPVLDDDSVEINDDNISVSKIELSNNNTEATIKLGYTLKDKQEIKVRVKGTIENYAGYGLKSKEEKLTVKEDTERPEAIGYKDVKKGKVTLIFNKDIKFDGSDSKIEAFGGLSTDDVFKNGDIKDWSEISKKVGDKMSEDYYHTNDSNGAYAAKIDGRELTLYFNEEKVGLPPKKAYINIKADKLKTLWDKKNIKIVKEVIRTIDETKLDIKTVEQDEDNSNKIKIKFNKEVDSTSATKSSNYELKDADGNKWNISSAEKDSDNKKKVILKTSKKLDAGKYTLTVKDVEDIDGKAMEKKTFKFVATEKDARTSEDIKNKVSLYNPGANDQKIVIDFDTKMKANKDEDSITNIKKYTLVAKDKDGNLVKAFDGKSSILVKDLYNSSIKAIHDDNKIELTVPYKSKKDDSYDFTKGENGRYHTKFADFDILEVHVGKVSDVDGNVNTTELIAKVGGSETIGIKKSKGEVLARAISTDKVEVTFDDKLDFKNKDIYIEDEDGKEVKISSWGNKVIDGKTRITMTLNKTQDGSQYKMYDDKEDHVLSYDGKLNGKKIYICTVAKPESKNDYDARLEGNIHQEVVDAIAPALIDNSKREDGYKFLGSNKKLGKWDNNDQAVEYRRVKDSDEGQIVLTFEEEINENSVSNNTFILDQDGDFKSVRIKNVKAEGNKVIIDVKGLKEVDKEGAKFGNGFDVIQNQPIADKSDINRGQGNQVSGINTQIGEFDNLADSDVVIKVDKTALDESVKNANDKIKDAAKYTKESVEKVQAALKKVEAAKTQEEVNAVKAEIDAAVAELKEVVDTADKSVVKFEITNRVGSPAPGQDIVIIELKDVDASKYDVLINEQKAKFNIKNKKFGGIVNSTLKGEELNKAIKVVLKK